MPFNASMLCICCAACFACAATQVSAASSFDEFQTPVFDVTQTIDTTEADKTNWKQTATYTIGVDDDSNTIINRLAYRAQWEGLSSENNFWTIDTKLRIFDDQDLQHDSDKQLDYDLNFNSLYLQKSFDQHSVKAGYQTVSLGFMDFITTTNVFTPQDFTEAVFTAPEDARIGQPIVYWTRYQLKQQWDVMLNLYPVENKYPGSNLRQILTGALGTDNFILQDGLPDALDEPELLIRTSRQNGPHEQQWIIASLLQNDPELQQLSLTPNIVYRTVYPRYDLFAGAYSYTTGNNQWKLEATYKNKLKPLDAFGTELDESSLALGWEYNANGDYTLTIEAANTQRHLPTNAVAGIETQFDQTVASWRKDFLHETVNVTVYIGENNPGSIKISSLSIRYTPIDDWVFELLSTYIDSDNNEFNLFTTHTMLRASYYW